MQIEKASKVRSIAYTFKEADGENIIQVVDNRLAMLLTEHPTFGTAATAWTNGYLTELRATASLASIPEAVMPDISVSDSENQALVKAIQSKWESARIHLSLWISRQLIGNVPDWVWVADLALQNEIYPYTLHEPKRLMTPNLAFEVGEGARIGISVKHITFNDQLLKINAGDRLTVWGSWRQEGFSIQPDEETRPIQLQQFNVIQRQEQLRTTVSANILFYIMPARTSRVSGVVRNTAGGSSGITVYVNEGDTCSATVNRAALAPGGSYTVTPGYAGNVAIFVTGGQTAVTTDETYNVNQ